MSALFFGPPARGDPGAVPSLSRLQARGAGPRMVVRIEKLAEMITPPEKHEESRRKAGDAAVDIARADLSFGYPPPPSRPWRKIALWTTRVLVAVAVALVAGYFGHLITGAWH
jgi:hypothetical protein